jgi:two-component system copper resistance phosphate regulon response regulator CusR
MRILVVEDQRNVARVVAKGLREQGYAVDVSYDGAEASERLELETYDLAILDLMLPGLDGIEVCRRLRERGATTPVLMLTARDDKASRIEGLDTGADDYLTKPFDFDELLARVRALLRRAPVYVPSSLVIGDLVLDATRHVATRAGRPVELTAKEFSVLEYLMRNPGRIVSREELSAHVWDERFDPFSNVIEVYIGRLRKKIDGESDVKLIHTRRGAGYLLEPRAGVAEE